MSARRGLVLVAALVVVTLSALSAGVVVTQTRAAARSSQALSGEARTLAAGRSSLRIALSSFAGQRTALLRGDGPELPDRWSPGGEGAAMACRIAELGADGARAVAEAAKLDANTAPRDALASVLDGAVDDAAGVADAIVSERERARLTSVAALARVDGIDTDSLFGEPNAEPISDGGGPISRRLTVWAFDPEDESGIGGDSADDDRTGAPRFDVSTASGAEVAQALRDRCGDDAEAWLGVTAAQDEDDAPAGEDRAGRGRGGGWSSRAELLGRLRANAPREHWAEALDTLATSVDPFALGRVDLLRASPEVIAGVFGIDRGAAEALASARETLSERQRRSLTWPLELGLVEAAAFEGAVDRLTSRSMQWRLRLEIIDASPDEPDGAPSSAGERQGERPPRMVLDVVVDAAARRVRLSSVRDLTHAGLARELRAAQSADADARVARGERSVSAPAEVSDLGADGSGVSVIDEAEASLASDAEDDFGSAFDLGGDESGSSADADEQGGGADAAGRDRRSGRWVVGDG